MNKNIIYGQCYVYVHTHTYIQFMCTCIHIHRLHTYVGPTFVHTYTYIHTYIHTYTHVYIHTYMHACMHTYTYLYFLTYLHVCTPYTYINTYIMLRMDAHIFMLYIRRMCCYAFDESGIFSWYIPSCVFVNKIYGQLSAGQRIVKAVNARPCQAGLTPFEV